jgi:hypothetical protein
MTVPVFFPGQYLVYTVRRVDVAKLIKIHCIDSVYPCGPRSNLDVVYYVWDSFYHYFMNHAITVGPDSPSEKVMFLAHYKASNQSMWHRSLYESVDVPQKSV